MSTMLARFLVAMVFLCALSAAGSAQSPTREMRRDEASAHMTPGAQVRVKLPGEHAWTGTLVMLAGDSMFVRGASGDDTTLVRLSQATYVNVSAGTRSSRHLVRNTAIGLGLGSLIGWQVGRSMTQGGCQKGDPCWENFCFLCDYVPPPNPPVTDHATAGTLIGGLAGGALGLLVSRKRTTDWRPVSITRHRTSISLSPRGGRVAVGF